jgi:NitT/TauT family transport system permease protein
MAVGTMEGDVYVAGSSEDALMDKKPFISGWRLGLLRAGLLVAIFGLWEFVSGDPRKGEIAFIDKFWVSQPSDIWDRLSKSISSGTLFFHIGITLQEMLMGLLFGAMVGITVGFTLGRNDGIARILDPFIVGIYSIPKLALTPLFILWFGIGMETKIVLVSVTVFFLTFLNTFSGVRDVDGELVDIVKLMGAGRWNVLRMIVIPSAMPWILTGLKLSVPYSLISAVVGEIMASNRGLGFLLVSSQGQFDTAGVFSIIFVLMIMGLIINELVNRTQNYLLRWKTAGR